MLVNLSTNTSSFSQSSSQNLKENSIDEIQMVSTAKKVVHWSPSSPEVTTSGVLDVMADYSYVARQTANNVGFDSHTLQYAGMTTACNSATGAVAFYNAILRRNHCAEIGYASGVTDNTIDAARGALQGLGGLSFVVYRPTAAACMILSKDASSIHATSVLGKIAFYTGTIGAGFFGGFYFCISLYFGRILHRSYNFFARVEHNKSLKDLRIDVANMATSTNPEEKKGVRKDLGTFLQEIYEQINVTSEQVIDRLCDKYGIALDKIDFNSSKQPDDEVQEGLLLVPKNQELEKLKNHLSKTAEEFKKKSVLFFKQYVGGLPLDSEFITKIKNGDFDAEKLKELIILHETGEKRIPYENFIKNCNSDELLGLFVEIVNRQASREAKVGDIIGSEALGMIKQSLEDNLKGRLVDNTQNEVIRKLAVEEVDKIIEAIQKERNFNFGVNFLLFVSGVIGLVGTALGFVQNTLAFVASGFIFQLCALAMLFADGAFLYRAMGSSNGDIGGADKNALLAYQVIGILSLACIIATASVFSCGTVPFAIAVTLGVIWILHTSGCLGLLARKEKKNFTQLPTLEKLRTVLDKKNIRDEDPTFWEYIGDFIWTCVGGQGTYTREDINQMITNLSEFERGYFEDAYISQMTSEESTIEKAFLWDGIGFKYEALGEKLNDYHEYSQKKESERVENDTYNQLHAKLKRVYEDKVAFMEAVESLWKEDKMDSEVSTVYYSLKNDPSVPSSEGGFTNVRKLNQKNQKRLNYHIFKLKSTTLAQRGIEAG
ncbi:MAG: hypothetical protein FJZ57_06150, partial [Chlamydiae bacterium]|nr:hypothetical protein [Chlamydiota bacterium]